MPAIIYSLTLKKLGINYSIDNLYRDVSINWTVSSIGFFLGIFSELNFIGRKNLCIITFALNAVFLIIATIVPKYFNIFFAISAIFANTAMQQTQTYTYELYSTKIREVAGGFFFMCTRIGGFSSQYLGVGLNNISTLLPYYILVAVGLILSILFAILPHDTYGHHLDVNIESEELEKLKENVREIEEKKKDGN